MATSGVAHLEIDRPDVRNAFAEQTWRELRQRSDELAGDETVRVVVLSGCGGCFSSGGDIRTMGPAGAGVLAPAHRLLVAQEAIRSVSRLPQPVIAAVEGFAIGVAWSLVLACDLVTAAQDAFFDAPFLKRAAVPDGGFIWQLSERLGYARTMDLLLAGQRVPAASAYDAGLVSRLARPGSAVGDALAQAAEIATLPVDAVRITKMLARGQRSSLDAALEREAVFAAAAGHGPDAKEGRQAFLEKRAPVFNAHFDLPATDTSRG